MLELIKCYIFLSLLNKNSLSYILNKLYLDSRIKELEDQLQRMRSLQERLDELSLQTSNEEMEHDVEG